jgi:integrase
MFQHRRRSNYAGDDERAFVSPLTGAPLNPKRYAATFRLALERAGIADYVRPCHDGRHSSITNAAAAGTSPIALMTRSGHADFKTTQVYIDLAGETFARRQSCWSGGFGAKAVRKSGTKTPQR